MSKRFDRTIALIGRERFDRLKNANVLIVGLGGVGGAAAEVLVRYGVGKLTFADGDCFEESNLNRQILCTADTIGKNKAVAAAERAKSINPDAEVRAFDTFYTKATADDIFSQRYDFVIDAIDDLENKVDLIVRCKAGGIPIVSATGAGNRLDCNFKVKDMAKTSYDWLARATRKALRDAGVKDVPAVCADGPAVNVPDRSKDSVACIPSCAAPPMVMGAMLAGYVAERLMGL